MPGKGRPFEKGNKVKLGKPSPGSGRTPNEFIKSLERALVEVHDIDYIKAVIAGVEFDRTVNKEGEHVKLPASTRDRLDAISMCWEYLYSKAKERIEVSRGDVDPLQGVPDDVVIELVPALRLRATGSGGAKP